MIKKMLQQSVLSALIICVLAGGYAFTLGSGLESPHSATHSHDHDRMPLIVGRFVKRRQGDPSNLKFQNRRVNPSMLISKRRIKCRVIICSQVVEEMIDA